VTQLNLDDIAQRIDDAFGADVPVTEQPLNEQEQRALERLFGDEGYQDYFQDQINRQIIRNYLLNAIVMRVLDEQQLSALFQQASTSDGRSALSLHMLMHSVEEAGDLPLDPGPGGGLKPVEGSDKAPPHMSIVSRSRH
jgi:hypothetical protein